MIARRNVVQGIVVAGILAVSLVTASAQVRIEKKARSSETVQAEIDAITGEFEYLKMLRFQLSQRLTALQDREKVLQSEKRRAMSREAAAEEKESEGKGKKGKRK